ncbi:glycosyltransferase family 4 protein [Oceanihabitans sediminis]|uniref:glycosyltransferase family 4 protein n=1 Tax=Oceanihabitans sediminis TaxID=1812012 RepID=UPI003A950021
MYPSKEKSFAGIFVKNQYEALKEIMLEDEVDIFFMKRKFTSKAGSVIKYIITFFRFFKILFKRYDIIHLHYFYPLIYIVYLYKLFYPNTKVIVTYHGSDVTKKINENNINKLKKISSIVDYHIPVGKALSEILEQKLNIKPNKILPVGVNDKVFFYEDKPKIFDFIYVGSFVSRKGVDVIIKALKNLDKSISVCFVGQGDYLKEIQELQKLNSNIKLYVGLSQDKIQHLIVQSKFLLLPTRNEGFPTSTIESMYCGVPVLVSDIPQTKEQVEDGVNGFIVPVDDVLALQNKMKELANINDEDYKVLVTNTLTFYKDISLTSVCNELIIIYRFLTKND